MPEKQDIRSSGELIPPRSAAARLPNALSGPPWLARREIWASLLLFLLVLSTFLPAIHNDFVGYDDPEYVTGNPHVQQGLSWATIRWAFTNTEVAAWHPLVWLSHALDCQCFGLQAWGHHLTGILLHALNAVLCFVVLHRLTGAWKRSWAVAALFALHPLRVESVAWVSERKDVLSLWFFFLTLWAYNRYVKAGAANPNQPGDLEAQQGVVPPSRAAVRRPSSKLFFLLALVFFVLGLMSKPMLVTVPFLLLLLDTWPLRRWSSSRAGQLLKEKIPFLVAAILVSLVTVLAQPPGAAVAGATRLLPRLENAAVSYCRYLGKLFWPANLAPFYPPIEHWPALIWLGATPLLVAMTLAAWLTRRTRPYLLIGWLWFLGTLVPVIGLVQIGEQSITDRYTYLPGIGIVLALVWGICEVTRRWRFQALALGSALSAVLLICWGLTRSQLTVWKNSETLFRHTLAVTRGNYLAHNNLGVVFDQQGHLSEAIEQFELALKIKPGYPEALKNLAVAYAHAGQLDNAVQFYEAALGQRPSFVAAHNGLGLVYQKQGRFPAAEQQFQECLRIDPDYPDAHFNLALELERQGRLEQAAAEFQKTLQLQPNSADVHSNLGVLFERQGKVDAALAEYLAAIRLSPNFARGYFNLGVVLTKKGLINEAIHAFETAVKLNPDYPAARTNLAILKSLGPK